LFTAQAFSKILGLELLTEKKIDFFKFRKPAFIASWMLVLAGVVSVVIHHDNILGKDFTGGDEMTISYSERVESDAIMQVFEENELGDVTVNYQSLIGEDREVLENSNSLRPSASHS
jgi:SecD/SecF fusion protein